MASMAVSFDNEAVGLEGYGSETGQNVCFQRDWYASDRRRRK